MNQKNQKGITLIALVITIIVLLILAGVTINMVLGEDGIIEQATHAKQTYEIKEQEEQESLGELSEEVDKVKYGEWKQNEDVITRGTTTIEVGQVVDYTPTVREEGYTVLAEDSGCDENQTINVPEGLTWKVLGVNEEGKIEIIPTTITNQIKLKGKAGVINVKKIVTSACSYLYSKDKKAEGNLFNSSSVSWYMRNQIGNTKTTDMINAFCEFGLEPKCFYGYADSLEDIELLGIATIMTGLDMSQIYGGTWVVYPGYAERFLWDGRHGDDLEYEVTIEFVPIVTLSYGYEF